MDWQIQVIWVAQICPAYAEWLWQELFRFDKPKEVTAYFTSEQLQPFGREILEVDQIIKTMETRGFKK